MSARHRRADPPPPVFDWGDGEPVVLDRSVPRGPRVVDESAEEQAQRGIRNLETLVAMQQTDPTGEMLYKAVRGLDLNEAHALLLLAVVGIAGGGDG